MESASCQELELTLGESDINVNAEIHCVLPNSCDNITIDTSSIYTKLFMHEFSNNVLFDNAAGYIRVNDAKNIICNNGKNFEFVTGSTSNISTVISSMQTSYLAREFPCTEVTVKCGMDQCDMVEEHRMTFLNDLLYYKPDTCSDSVKISEFQNVSCPGSCLGLGTRDPTTNPTSEPTTVTNDPTDNPTHEPTANPTNDPSQNPTQNPTTNPSISPTTGPTIDPTPSPTRNPTTYGVYNAYIEVTYALMDVIPIVTEYIANHVTEEIDNIRLIIEEGYVKHQTWPFLNFG